MGYLGHITKLYIKKVWYEGHRQLSQEKQLVDDADSSNLDRFTDLVLGAEDVSEDFYPVDPASPMYIVEVFSKKTSDRLSISGNLMMFDKGHAEAVAGHELVDFLETALDKAEIKSAGVKQVLEMLSATS